MLRAVATRAIVCGDRFYPACFLTYKRRFATTESEKNVQIQKEKPIARKVAKIKKYWFFRYVDYIKNYDETLEKTFPRMMHVYRLISVGTKDLYVDLKKYISIKKKEALHGSESLTSDELQLNHRMPRDIAKISPVLLVLAIPFTNYVLFPVAYFFPRQILTAHYWTPEQKDRFMAIDHKYREKYIVQVFQSLDQQGQQVAKLEGKGAEDWFSLLKLFKDKKDPSPKRILACKSLFVDAPFSIEKIKRAHVRELLLIHGISTWTFNKREALRERGILIKRMDTAIMKEGSANKMSPNVLKTALSFRGIDPTQMSTKGMESWMEKWLEVSVEIDDKSISLLLHCPVLLAYNWNTC